MGEGADVNVLETIEKALEKFKKGETSRLVIAPKHAFGHDGNKEFNIPPNATVEYVVTLKSFEKVNDILYNIEVFTLSHVLGKRKLGIRY